MVILSFKQMNYLPSTIDEIRDLGWEAPDIILVTGDTYIDSPFIGVAAVGRLLEANGFRVAVLAQPERDGSDIDRLGEPTLFWGVSGGSVDSMVANYTPSGKKRNQDDFTPGELNTKRPDRAVIHYTNLIRARFKNGVPVVLGGIEASLRRVSHYDFWSDSVRRSILFDARGDYLVYGMGEQAVLELAFALREGISPRKVKGLAYIHSKKDGELPENYIGLPSHEKVSEKSESGKEALIGMFDTFYRNNDPKTARGLIQPTGDRFLVQNPPQNHPDQKTLDSYYSLTYLLDLHPFYRTGKVRALDTIRFSLTTHRGCYGECNFCAITVHQGRTVLSRSESNILTEVGNWVNNRSFRGIVSDVGGPTANMYGYECKKKIRQGVCDDQRCIYPETCSSLPVNHQSQIQLLKKIEAVKGVKKVFVASGIRPDLVQDDKKYGESYIKQIAAKNTSGQLKLAPEHSSDQVLNLMGKPSVESTAWFADRFRVFSEREGKKQFLTYYFIAAHPGCAPKQMVEAKKYANSVLGAFPEQVQIYTPTPSTWSSIMYYTELDPFSPKVGGRYKKIFVEKRVSGKVAQKEIITGKGAPRYKGRPRQNHYSSVSD